MQHGRARKLEQGHATAEVIMQAACAGVSYLIIHELKREGRLADSSTANHDHFVQGQTTLALALVCSHLAGFLRRGHTDRRPSWKAVNDKDKDLEAVRSTLS